MTKFYPFIFLMLLFGCNNTSEDYKLKSRQIKVSGKIINPDITKKELLISVFFPGRSNETVRAQVDGSGSFSASFISFTPTDIFVDYNAGFYALVHPGDSIFIVFDGDKYSTVDVLKSVEFSGDAAQLNHDVAAFQQMYFSNETIHDQSANEIAVKELNAEAYLSYLLTIRTVSRQMLKRFIKQFDPKLEAKIWASTFVEKDYFFALSSYPDYHRYLNKLSRQAWDVPQNYYDSLLNFFPINKSMLICGSALSGLINTLHYDYLRFNIFLDPNYDEVVSMQIDNPDLPQIKDSLVIQGIIKLSPDKLTTQLVLTEMIHQEFDINQLDLFEQNRDFFEKTICEPFLIEPIIERYKDIRFRLTNPKSFSDQIFEKADNSSINKIMSEILTKNEGKVIYINFWATWCAPCLGAFPGTMALLKEMKNKDVAFVFICIDSKQSVWAEKVRELTHGGQHYFLTEEQSNDMHEVFEFTGVPYHVLIGKNGTIHEQGAHMHGNTAKNEIDKLLDKTGQ